MSKTEIAGWAEELTAWRRHLHRNPELAFEERETAGFVAEKLRSFGVDEVHEGLAKTGVVGVLRGRSGGSNRAIGLRADMDALPITEATGLDHASRHPGRMHACGHDGHMTMLLGAARYLAETRNFGGTVYLIFQPAEEQAGGGRVMVKEGLFERFPMQAVYGLHNWPGMKPGVMALRPGPMMASMDTFQITVRGKGSHAAMPHLGVDPIVVGSAIVTALQSIVSRETTATDPLVVSVTQFHAGEADNVIAETAELRGTVRAFDEAARKQVEEAIKRLPPAIAEAHRATAEVAYQVHYPPTLNTEEETAFAAEVAKATVGADKVLENFAPSMGAEDFAFLLQESAGCYAWIGSGEESAALHSPYFDFNDAVLPIGASYWAELAERALARGQAT